MVEPVLSNILSNAPYNSSLREAAPRRGWRLGRSHAAGFTVYLGTSRSVQVPNPQILPIIRNYRSDACGGLRLRAF
ncbi:hypothetical protein [Nostoc sp.]|uniref:hypothetical protein n=1 Tax=Nostoc sp. TaxID=1180 RepID=UPI002FFC2B13